MAERSSGGGSVSRVALVAAGGTLVVVGFLWGRHLARRRTAAPHAREHLAPTAPPVPPEPENTGSGLIMKAELERLAGVAVSHGPDDPAIEVFLSFVGALDPRPDAATLKPAAERIGALRLAQALDQPGEAGAGASRLLAAASEDEGPELLRGAGVVPRTVTAESPVETGRRLPELFEALLQAIRVALGLFA